MSASHSEHFTIIFEVSPTDFARIRVNMYSTSNVVKLDKSISSSIQEEIVSTIEDNICLLSCDSKAISNTFCYFTKNGLYLNSFFVDGTVRVYRGTSFTIGKGIIQISNPYMIIAHSIQPFHLVHC